MVLAIRCYDQFTCSGIVFCGDDDSGGTTVALTDPLVLDIAGDGLSVINQGDSNGECLAVCCVLC